ncbi:hypothetical protein C8R44DRAFT_766341 [Mycena epipterygia]|nr:hypothetical protein C8R44DRAFT_766341 [Mycena epipterygia]
MAAGERLSSRAPARQAAQKASTKFGAQLMSSPVKPDEKSSAPKPPKRTRSRPNLKRDPVVVSSSSRRTRPTGQPRLGSRKRPVSLDSRKSDGEESDLTSLSTRTASPTPRLKAVSSAPRVELEDTDHQTLTYVWVLLDSKGKVFELVDEGDEVERIWWPGLVMPQYNSKFRIQLFGTIGAARRNTIVDIKSPHAGNILSFCTADEAIRFTKPSYVPPLNNSAQSPKKRQKLDRTDLEAQWSAALSHVVREYLDSEMPSLFFISSVHGIDTSIPPPPKGNGKGKGKAYSEDELSALSDVESTASWSPPPPDASLEIPGEIVFAREKKGSKGPYWAAQIQSHTNKGRYAIKWMDNTLGEVDRDMFYSYEEDGFGTCQLGVFVSSFKEVVNDDDEPDAPADHRLSPEPRDPPPSGDAFCELSIHEQFVYTKPVMQAILREEYGPARETHKLFIGGKKGRQSVAKDAGERGMMDPRDVTQFLKCLKEWCMRNTHKGEQVGDVDQAGVGSGSETAEAPKPNDETGAHPTDGGEVEKDAPKFEGDDEAHDVAAAVEASTEVFPGAAKKYTDDQIGIVESNARDDVYVEKHNDDPMQDVEINENPAEQETLCTPASPTATILDANTSSPAPVPPSSSFAPDSDAAVDMFDETDVKTEAAAPPAELDDDTGNAFETSSTLSEASDISELIPRQKPPRQIGCDAYEGLSTLEKLDYCLNVLLPELLIQIFVWRKGERTSVGLLSPERELELHKLGAAERKKTDWVFDAKRLRETKERELERNTETVTGGTASRPKRVLRR